MNLPNTHMERCSQAATNANNTIRILIEIGLSKEANIVNELREATKALNARLIQLAENEISTEDGILRTQLDVMLKLDEFSLIFREKIYLEFLKKVNSLTLQGGCYDMAFDAAVTEIESLGDRRIFDFLNQLDVNRKYRRGCISEDLHGLLPREWSAYRIWQEIRKFTDYKKSCSHGVEFATFFGHPVTPVNYLR